MIPTNEGNINGKCCFKCKWRAPVDIESIPKVLAPNGAAYIPDFNQSRVCTNNPDGKWLYGDTRQVCPMFELNRERWVTLTISRHEYEYRKKHPEQYGPLDCLI